MTYNTCVKFSFFLIYYPLILLQNNNYCALKDDQRIHLGTLLFITITQRNNNNLDKSLCLRAERVKEL